MGRLELLTMCLSVLGISLSHLACTAAGSLKSYNELNSNCLYTDTKKYFILFLDVICLKFLYQKYLLQVFLAGPSGRAV